MATDTDILFTEFGGSMAWRAADLRDDEWRLALPGPVITELGAVVDKVRGATVPAVALRPEDFLLPATRQFMAKVRSRLREGRGFVVLNGLPVREWAGAGSTLAYWLLSGLVARPVAQKLDGTLVSDVHDTGLQATPGSGVRPDKTSIEQYFHSDNAYNRGQPEFVGLLCLQSAVEGGRSGVASIRAVHNDLLRQHPAALARLYQPFLFDRQKEHAAGEPGAVSAPIFASDKGELKMRMGLYRLLNAYRLPGKRARRGRRAGHRTAQGSAGRSWPVPQLHDGSGRHPVCEQPGHLPSPHCVHRSSGA